MRCAYSRREGREDAALSAGLAAYPLYPIERAKSSKRRRCSSFKCVGRITVASAYKSPRLSGCPSCGIPCPRKRNDFPLGVSAGIRSISLRPSGVDTLASPPSIAVASGTSTVVCSVVPSLVKRGSGRIWTRR